jgi:spoIIIJ-associated protein
VAHAEASARTVDAAVTAASAQLGLRPDQVDIEVLEDPVPSTFGYIGTPARVRVTPLPGVADQLPPASAADAPPTAQPAGSVPSGTTAPFEAAPTPTSDPGSLGTSASSPGSVGPAAPDPDSAVRSTTDVGPAATSTIDVSESSDEGSEEVPTPPNAEDDPNVSSTTKTSDAADYADAQAVSRVEPMVGAGLEVRAGNGEPSASTGRPDIPTVAPAASAEPAAHIPGAQPSSAAASDGIGNRASDGGPATASSSLAPTASSSTDSSATAPDSVNADPSSATRPPRRTYRDEPVDPAMVEADTERAGDFLEGLLDALDVDGDITTWVDEVGGHIDLEGTDLDVLVGSNGETLDALQELTRLAVLRQSKRRVRLLLDINGFRSRQREELVAIVTATAEQVIRTREDYEFQPMTPAERKIVHDAVAAIEGARTESLGEDPHRRVVIRPA